jgi:hypothetical protein
MSPWRHVILFLLAAGLAGAPLPAACTATAPTTPSVGGNRIRNGGFELDASFNGGP